MLEYHFYENRYVIGGELNVDKVGCECCCAEVPLRPFRRASTQLSSKEEEWLLCDLCASSFISNHQDYRDQYTHCADTTQAMAFCTNQILTQLGKFEGVETKPLPEGWYD